MAADWSDAENDLIVADYFSMLADDLARQSYNKAAHNRALQEQTGRSKGSIEYKLQNVSAVLKGFGELWIDGYKPAFNYQSSLEDAVDRRLRTHPTRVARPRDLAETPILWLGPPPTLRNAPPPAELDQMTRVARKFDIAGRDARNRELGRAGEERVVRHERVTLRDAGLHDLADRVRWVSDLDGDGAGYDILSFAPDGAERLIEVKTTNGWERTPFHLTRNELDVAEECAGRWSLVRLWNFAREPRAFELRWPLAPHVSLIASAFEARFETPRA